MTPSPSNHADGLDIRGDGGANGQPSGRKAPIGDGGQHGYGNFDDCIGCDDASKLNPDCDKHCPSDVVVE